MHRNAGGRFFGARGTWAAFLLLLLASARCEASDDLVVVIKPSAVPAENCASIRNALSAPANRGKRVVLMPGATFEIDCRIRIRAQQALEIPVATELVWREPKPLSDEDGRVAIEIQAQGQLLGSGTLRTLPKFLDAKAPRTGVLLSGSEGILEFGSIQGFEYGVALEGDDRGSAYNEVRLRSIMNALHAIHLDASGKGWANQNYVHVNRIWTNLAAESPPGFEATFGIFIDSHSDHLPNGNRFSGSIENLKQGVHLSGMYNRLDGLRLELPKGSTKVEIDQTSWYKKSCKKPDPAKRCFPTRNNWWFGEYGKVDAASDIRMTEAFREGATAPQATSALVGFGVEGYGAEELKAKPGK